MKILSIIISIIVISQLSAFSQTYQINSVNGQTINTCSGTFYDSGGSAGTYQNSENYSVTFCSNMAGAQIILDFTEFNCESATFDNLTIYDGPNTTSMLIGTYGGSALNGQVVQSGSGCLTLVWVTDGSVTYAGWTANISCSFPPQDFDAFIASASIPYYNGDTIKMCQGQPITFTAGADFYNNDINYNQTMANTTFEWNFGDGSPLETGQSVTHTFPDGGGYFVTLNAYDVMGHDNVNLAQNMVMVSTSPTFVGTTLAPDTICLGEQVDLSGFVQSQPWGQTIPPPYALETFLPDNSSGFYQTAITYEIFTPGQTLNNINDLQSVCVTMEHSYLGDLTLQLICPSGQTVDFIVYPSSCGSTFLGVPIDDDTNLGPGTGYEYCWSPTATNGTWGDNCSSGSTLPAGTYEAASSWNTLIGCPLNGDWQIFIFDNLGSDNGYIFEWMINFNPAIIPTNLWEFQNTYPVSDMAWVGDNIVVNNNNNAVAEPTSDGDIPYYFTVLDDFGCPYDTTVFIHVLPAGSPGCCSTPSAYAGPDDEICGTIYDLAAVLSDPANTGAWTSSGPGTATFSDVTSPTSSVTVTAYGMYTFSWTESNAPACEDVDNVKITFYEPPSSDFDVSPVSCYGDNTTVTYTGTGTNFATYTWDFDGATTNPTGQGPHNIQWVADGTHTISLTVSENGCTSTETSHNVIYPAELTSTVGPGNIECPGDFTSVAVDVEGGTTPYTYTWDPDPGSITNIGPGTYNLTITDNNGCTNFHNFTIVEPPDFIYANFPENLICYEDNSGEIAVDYTGGTPPYTYSWTGPAGYSASTEDISGIAAGTYNLVIEDAGGCTLTDAINITQPAQLTATITASTNISCFGVCDGTATVTGAGGTIPYSYLWSTIVPNASVTGLCAGNASVTIADDHNCIASTSVTITQPDLLTITVEGTDINCFGDTDGTITVTPTGGTPPYSYAYSPALSNSGTQNNVAAGNYTLTVTDAHGCFEIGSVTITQPTAPLNVTYTQTNLTCFAENVGSINISVTGGTPSYSYAWSNGMSSEDLTSLGAGSYSVTVTDNHGCFFITGTEIIQPSRVITVASTDKYICIDGSTVISASSTGGTSPYNYSWSNGPNTASQTVSPTISQMYYLSVTDANGCSGNIEDVYVHVYDSLSLKLSAQDYTICEGEPAVIYSVYGGGNGGPYILTHQGEYVGNPFIDYPTATTTYSLNIDDMCTSPNVSKQITIEVIPNPIPSFTWDKSSGCQPHTVQFNAVCEPNYVSYSWDFSDSENNFSFLQNPLHVFQEDGIFDISVTVIDSIYGCTSSVTYEDIISVYPLPTAKFLSDPQITSILKPEIFFNNLSELNFYNYWFFGDTDSSSFISPQHRYPRVGEYEVKLVVETEHGCKDSTTNKVRITDEFTFWAPNAFTPNRSMPNDIFAVWGTGIDPDDFNMYIYDRWGELIFHTNQYDNEKPTTYGWDGRVKENKLGSTGVYRWLVIYRDTRGNMIEKSGHVTLIR
ncbi:MAG: PKD domain-containing protein [Bacteroidales bacterium]|nr:PKD domain-containing protein [Bacteroidales bacterium]